MDSTRRDAQWEPYEPSDEEHALPRAEAAVGRDIAGMIDDAGAPVVSPELLWDALEDAE